MIVFLVIAGIALFAAAGIARHGSERLRKHGIHALVYRWLTGQGWTGKALTNRGWTRPATKALTATGHAPRRHYLPRLHHAAFRTSVTLATALAAAGVILRPSRTLAYLGMTGAGAAAYGAHGGWVAIKAWQHNKNYVKPLHARLTHHVPVPLSAAPSSWIEVPQDRSYAEITMPRNIAVPAGQERQAIEAAATATLGMKGARTSWTMTGPRMKLRLTMPVPCPDLVRLNTETDENGKVTVPGVREAIVAAGPYDIILGYAPEERVSSVSLRNDSPHLALSADTGKGKSVVVRCILPQVLLRGGIAAVLDNKMVSHPWARGLPNVAYCDSIEKIHDFLVWLDAELTRRSRFIRDHTDVNGNLTGSPGPQLFVVLEELNLLANRLQGYWDTLRAEDKARPKEERENLPVVSPAKRALENASYIGRELQAYLLLVSQRLSARATAGSADVRMNIGTRMLAGYDDDTWKMLVGKQTQMPPPSRHAGRMQVYVKGGDLTETQIAFFTHEEARQIALSGDGKVPAKLRHLTEFAPSATRPAADAGDQHDAVGSAPDGPLLQAAAISPVPQAPKNTMTLRQAKDAGLVPSNWGNVGVSFRVAKHRAKSKGIDVPEVLAKRGNEAIYDAIALADFLETVTAGK